MNGSFGGSERASGTARALWFPAARTCALHDEKLGPVEPGSVLVRTLFSGISRGTESLVFNGLVPEGERERMRGPHMAGDFPFPVKYGYALVGRVENGPEHLAGRTVFCLHPHQDATIVAEDMVTPLPENVPPERAILAANMETALNIVWDAQIMPGDRVAVFGAGVVGALTAFIATAIIGTDVVLVDRNPARRALAGKLGIGFAESGALDGDFDLLINASASGEALTEALDHAGFEARIVEASWYGDKPLTLPLGGPFHSQRLSLVSSQVGALPPARRARWTFARRLAKALELLGDDRLEALISGETAFEELAAAYPAILDDPATLCHRIRY
ncbi:zinc-dependent alcohol dehydrogenase [Martelella soudanensis]|uniref:zinc-dependent alcohol dehydrogenase n=1 Tax=unclassified Martelella TaxID=2629616 RepID=UPI0015DE8044|nr:MULTISPECIES: zinc-binding alcohol dehydrogenase [unclassified Martelella]